MNVSLIQWFLTNVIAIFMSYFFCRQNPHVGIESAVKFAKINFVFKTYVYIFFYVMLYSSAKFQKFICVKLRGMSKANFSADFPGKVQFNSALLK